MKTIRLLCALVLLMITGICHAQQEYETLEDKGWTFCNVERGVTLSGEGMNVVCSSVGMGSSRGMATQLYVYIWGFADSKPRDIAMLDNIAKNRDAYGRPRELNASISLYNGRKYNGIAGYAVDEDFMLQASIIFNLELMTAQGGSAPVGTKILEELCRSDIQSITIEGHKIDVSKLNTAPTIKGMLKTLAERVPGRFSPKDDVQASLRKTETIERLDPAIAAKDSANVSTNLNGSGSGVSRQLKERATNGDAKAQYELGHQYAISNDFDEAAKWYAKAANQGYGEAQGELAMFYLDGRGVEKDETQAAYWIKQWAAQGDALGQLWLGRFYYNGIGVGQDFTTAALWFEKSADQGNMDAIFSLGLCYYEGKGMVKDYNRAFSLFQRAANVNDPNQVSTPAMIYLSKCYANGQGIAKDMDKARQWMERAAQMGDADAQEALQEM